MADDVEIAWTAGGTPHVIKRHVNGKFHTACGRYLLGIKDTRHVDARRLSDDTCRICARSAFVYGKTGYRMQPEIRTNVMTTPDTKAEPTNEKAITALTEAYHAVYDVKDVTDGQADHGTFYAAYELTNQIAAFIERLGGQAPNRRDGEGRKDSK
jgi:hypothetical protein